MAALAAACGSGSAPPGGDAGIDADTTGPDASMMCPEPPPPPSMCDFYLGCGCDMAGGQKCTIIGEERVCATAGAGQGGSLCDTEADCAAGTMCITYGGVSSCMIFCDDSHPCPGLDLACYVRVRDAAMNTIASLCGQVCVLLDQDCALPGQACYTSSAVDQPDRGVCVTAGVLMQDEPCMSSNDCLPGLNCINPSGAMQSICAAFCDIIDQDPGCPAGYSCAMLTGHTQTGVCVTP